MVPLEAHEAPERVLTRSALLPVVLSGMPAFDLHLVLQHLPDHRKLSMSQQLAKQRNGLLTFQGAVLVY